MNRLYMEQKEIIIAVKRKKLLVALTCSFFFVGLCALAFPIALNNEETTTVRLLAFIHLCVTIPLISIVICSLTVKILHYKKGLTINEQGMTDTCSHVSAGFIPWRDIKNVIPNNFDFKGTNYKGLSILVRNPEKYLKRGNFARRFFAWLNMKWTGTPVQISNSSLVIDFDELYQLIMKHLERHLEWDEERGEWSDSAKCR